MSTGVALRTALFGLLAAAVLSACGITTAGGDGKGADVVAPATVRPVARTPGMLVPTASATPPARPVIRPCAGNTRVRLVFVSLHRQHLWMCSGHRVVRDTPITGGRLGRNTETPTGSYRIQGLNRDSVLTPSAGGASYPVKYWIPFDAPQFGFHDSPWQRFPYGSELYKTRGSHGCVRMPLAAIRFLYRWAHIGTPVRITA